MEAHQHLILFCEEYEVLYYQREVSRLHFVRQAIHSLSHICVESHRTGPWAITSQWPMERTIGNLEDEMRQPSNIYGNLKQRASLRCQMNALKCMLPDLDPPARLPTGAKDLGDGYVLLRAYDNKGCTMTHEESRALIEYLRQTAPELSQDAAAQHTFVNKWARLYVPNGQTARSAWKERINESKRRVSRNVKVYYIILPHVV